MNQRKAISTTLDQKWLACLLTPVLVTCVTANMTVGHAEAPAGHESRYASRAHELDDEIRAAIEAGLAKAKISGVRVTVAEQVATLEGRVSKKAMQRVLEIANTVTPRALKILNKLSVQ